MVDGSGAVNAIAELEAKSLEKEVGGIQFTAREMKPVIFEPRPESLDLDSLSGLVELLTEPIDSDLQDKQQLLIHVASYREVNLYGKLRGKYRKRDLFAKVKLNNAYETFPFGEFLVSEAFQIKLRSQFKHTSDIDDLFTFTSKLTVTDEVGTKDDGITQEVSVRRGMSGALTEKATSKPIVTLKPYRTFREIEQPESEFLFRMRGEDGKIPKLALIEADGGAWQLTAVQSIAEYFKQHLPTIKVVY